MRWCFDPCLPFRCDGHALRCHRGLRIAVQRPRLGSPLLLSAHGYLVRVVGYPCTGLGPHFNDVEAEIIIYTILASVREFKKKCITSACDACPR